MDLSSLFSVKDKVVLVTGGGRGIGYYIANGFVTNGATVYITSRTFETCQQAATELTKKGPGKCIALPSRDLATASACQSVAEELKKKETRLDILVNNSGTSWGEPLEKHSEKGFDKVFDLNVKGLFFMIQACLPLLNEAAKDDDPARIINIGSIAGLGSNFGPTYAYDASKAAVHHLTRKLAGELSTRRITVNAIAPGFVPSKMSDQLLTYASKEEWQSNIPLGRLGTPEDMAAIAIYLSSRAGAWVTGAIVPVDGGAVIAPSKL